MQSMEGFFHRPSYHLSGRGIAYTDGGGGGRRTPSVDVGSICAMGATIASGHPCCCRAHYVAMPAEFHIVLSLGSSQRQGESCSATNWPFSRFLGQLHSLPCHWRTSPSFVQVTLSDSRWCPLPLYSICQGCFLGRTNRCNCCYVCVLQESSVCPATQGDTP